MRLPVIRGLIRRRLLVNYRVDADVMQRLLPGPFRPKLHCGHAIAGICLIRLEQIRPAWLPRWCGIASENAAHRIAVLWDDAGGAPREGVYIPRRDTGSLLNYLGGGRLFPGEHHRARFDVTDDGRSLSMRVRSHDGAMEVTLRGTESDALPATSRFASLAEASAFFEAGHTGYSVTRAPHRLDGLRLRTEVWQLRPFDIAEVASTFFSDDGLFPPGSAIFDHALIMRNACHRWHQEADMVIEDGAACCAGERKSVV